MKMQNVNFGSVDEFLDFLPEDEKRIVLVLRKIIQDAIPGVKEKLSYNVPYYKRYKNICFIWPAAVLWGTKKSYTGVRLGFINGNLLNDELNYLDKEGRKQIATRDFNSLADIDAAVLKAYIFEAVQIDEKLYRTKK